MNKELLEKLKQAYSHLGLAENVLQMHADALVATGLVTAENIDGIVAKQKDFLEGLQKYNDTRVSEAVKKAGEKAQKDAEEAAKKAAEEARKAKELAEKEKTEAAKKAAEEAAQKAREEALKVLPDSFKTYMDSFKAENEAREAAQKEKEDAWMKTLNEMRDTLNGFKKENEELKKAQAEKDRKDAILNKAKELGIPQYRIDEGFVIAQDATEEQYTAYLSNIAKNIKANRLPGKDGYKLPSEQDVTKEEVDSIAANMVHNL